MQYKYVYSSNIEEEFDFYNIRNNNGLLEITKNQKEISRIIMLIYKKSYYQR